MDDWKEAELLIGNIDKLRVDKLCEHHNRPLLKCNHRTCGECWYKSICRDDIFCGECADNIHNSISNGSQRIYQEEFKHVAFRKYKWLKNVEDYEKDYNPQTAGFEARDRLYEAKEKLKAVTAELESVRARMR